MLTTSKDPVTKHVPAGPTLAEKGEHELLGHVQFRSWCMHCVVKERGTGPGMEIPDSVPDFYVMDESEADPCSPVKNREGESYFVHLIGPQDVRICTGIPGRCDQQTRLAILQLRDDVSACSAVMSVSPGKHLWETAG